MSSAVMVSDTSLVPAVTVWVAGVTTNFAGAAAVTVSGLTVADRLSVESVIVIEVVVEAVVSVALKVPLPLASEPVGNTVEAP